MPAGQLNPGKTLLKSLAMAIVCTAIAFFVGNFIGISSLMMYSAAKHVTPDYTIAYRYVGFTCAIFGFLFGLALGIYWDLREAGKPQPHDRDGDASGGGHV